MEADYCRIKLKESRQRFKFFLDLKLEMKAAQLLGGGYFGGGKSLTNKMTLTTTPLLTTLYHIIITIMRKMWRKGKCYASCLATHQTAN